MERSKSEVIQLPHRGPRMRPIWATTSLLLTLAMISVAWLNRARVVKAVSDLDRSQGEVLLAAVRETLRTLPAPPDGSGFDSLLARHANDGLTSVTFLASDDRLLASAGTPRYASLTGLRPASEDPPPVSLAGGRVRMFGFYRPTTATSGGLLQWGERGGRQAALPTPSLIVIEFDPILARDLLSDADRTFGLAALTGAVLVAVTLLFWRLSVLYDEAEQRNERARRLAMLGEMSAVLAHEIRNPLASLKGNAQLLARRLTAESVESRKAGLVVAEAERLEALTSDLLDFVRSGPIDIRLTDPVDLVASCIEGVAPDGILLRSDGAPRSWPLDARRIRQAIVNLLGNAVEASPPGVKPSVTVGQEGGRLVVAVQDAGEGIQPGDEERVFAPFFTTKLNGTGLGLAIARRVAEAHGGTLVASNSGGALFRILLPAQPVPNGARHRSRQ